MNKTKRTLMMAILASIMATNVIFQRGRSRFLACSLALVCLFFSLLPAHSATITTNIVVLGNGNFNISVYPGKAAYTSLVNSAAGVFGDGTVLDYRFVNCVSGAVNFAGYAVGAGDRVLAPTNASSLAYANTSNAKVWTVNDPGTNFSTSADYTADTGFVGTTVKGEVNIAGMYTGTLYLICGKIPNYTAFNHVISLVMSGADKTPISMTATNLAQPGNYYLWEFSLGDVAGYEKISYNCNLESYSRGRFMGFILDGETPPLGTMILIR